MVPMITDNQGFFMQNYAHEFLRTKQQSLLYRSRQVESSFDGRHGIKEKVLRDCIEETVKYIRENPYFGGINASEIL
jgi:hypothetical protein